MSDEPENTLFAWVADNPLSARMFVPSARDSFLKALRDTPEEVIAHIGRMRTAWMISCGIDTDRPVFFDPGKDEQKLVDFLKERFADEIAALPAASA